MLSGIVTAWFNAAPTPIPVISSLKCASDPYSSQICALYYILRNTLLSGSIGQQIIPMLTVVIDLTIILRFAKMIRNLLRSTEGITGGGT
jgi:hypothetical protein